MDDPEYWTFPQAPVKRPDVLDAHEKPPQNIKAVYKAAQQDDKKNVYFGILHNSTDDTPMWKAGFACQPEEFRRICDELLSDSVHKPPDNRLYSLNFLQPPFILNVKAIPGLSVYPDLLPERVQLQLLDSLLHRHLSNPAHNTNVHLHYDIPYARLNDSFFNDNTIDSIFQPKDPSIHKPITTQQFLEKKLRWMTLGGQYDWTNKVYPPEQPPPFPLDLKKLLEGIFPMKAEAAIANIYSPGDTLSLHRDVSEESGQPLVSISLGCTGTFVVGLDEVDSHGQPRIATLTLRSGDAVLMSGKARYAWHGVPKVLEGTCPKSMVDWPCLDIDEAGGIGGKYDRWRGWMKGKRINLNVRQMFDVQQQGQQQGQSQGQFQDLPQKQQQGQRHGG